MLNNLTAYGTSRLGDSVADGGKPVISHVGMGIKHEADNKPDLMIERK